MRTRNRIGVIRGRVKLALHEIELQPTFGKGGVRGVEQQIAGEQARVDPIKAVLLPGDQIFVTPLISDEVCERALEGVRR